MTVENRAGGPLLDVRLAIRPIGGVTEYDKLISRLEGGESRSVSLGEFNGRDGTPFSLRFVRPKDVRITATDLVEKCQCSMRAVRGAFFGKRAVPFIDDPRLICTGWNTLWAHKH